jgi:hypothetical protein
MIGGKRVKAGLDISEVLLEKDGHIRASSIFSNKPGRGFPSSGSICLSHMSNTPGVTPNAGRE